MGVTNNMFSVFLALSAICPMISPFICGPLMEKDPQVFLIIELVYFILTIILFAIILIVLKKSSKPVVKTIVYPLNNVIECKY